MVQNHMRTPASRLNPPDFSTLYTPGEKGYLDYPMLPGAHFALPA